MRKQVDKTEYPIAVLANTVQQFYEFCRDLKMNPLEPVDPLTGVKYKLIIERRHLMGMRFSGVMEIGTWHPNHRELKKELSTRMSFPTSPKQ